MYRKLTVLSVFILLMLVLGAGGVHAYELTSPGIPTISLDRKRD